MSISQLFQNLREHQIKRKGLKSADLIFAYGAIAPDDEKVRKMLVLIQDALDGKRGKVIDADLGIGTPGDGVLL
jgi:hypothetical protein